MLIHKSKVAIILPAHNECQALGKLIKEIPLQSLSQLDYSVEVIVVDNGSTDDTRVVAEQSGAKVIVEPIRGKGMAVKAAFKAVEADFYIMLDADDTYPPEYIIKMLEMLKNHDVVIGSRITGRREKDAFRWLNFTGNLLLSMLATIIYGKWISDVCTGYWGFRDTVIKNICLDHVVGFEIEASLFSQIATKGYSLAEIPILYRRRTGGPPKLRLMRDGLKIAGTLIIGRFRGSK